MKKPFKHFSSIYPFFRFLLRVATEAIRLIKVNDRPRQRSHIIHMLPHQRRIHLPGLPPSRVLPTQVSLETSRPAMHITAARTQLFYFFRSHSSVGILCAHDLPNEYLIQKLSKPVFEPRINCIFPCIQIMSSPEISTNVS